MKNEITYEQKAEWTWNSSIRSYHSAKLRVSIFLKSGNFVVTKENMFFCLIGYEEHSREAIEILFEWKQSLMVTFNFGQ